MSKTSNQIQELRPEEKRTLLAHLLQKRGSQPKYFPLSFAQERLWFLDQFQPGTPLYNIPFAIGLPGRLNMEALERSLSEIIRRHEILRTTFAVVDGRPVQIIHTALPLELPTIDLRRLPARERESEVARLASQTALDPFDLMRGPLMRTLLVRRSEHDHLLLLTMHHIISDAWSMGIFFHEFSLLYEAYCAHQASPLPELTVQYADFAQWQRQWLSGPRLEQLLGYWREQLRGAPTVLELPTDHARPA
ncbi:MAG TPA: condensation domain-containing protein, partial [Pyrinomonadaceae bacterium]